MSLCVTERSALWLCVKFTKFIFSSFHELMRSRGVRRPSVCPSVHPSVCKLCANRYFYHKHDSIATKLAHDGPQTGLHPGCAQGQGQDQKSRDTDTFVISRKSLLLTGTDGPASRLCSRSRSRSKVT